MQLLLETTTCIFLYFYPFLLRKAFDS